MGRPTATFVFSFARHVANHGQSKYAARDSNPTRAAAGDGVPTCHRVQGHGDRAAADAVRKHAEYLERTVAQEANSSGESASERQPRRPPVVRTCSAQPEGGR